MPASDDQPKAEPKAKPKYTAEVRGVARATRDLLGPSVKAPGAKQCAAVVGALGDRTPADAAGVPMARLRRWAKEGERPDDFAELRGLAKKVGDPWATGRKLAAILVSIDAVRKAS